MVAFHHLFPSDRVRGSENSPFPMAADENAVAIGGPERGITILVPLPLISIGGEEGRPSSDADELFAGPENRVDVLAFFAEETVSPFQAVECCSNAQESV